MRGRKSGSRAGRRGVTPESMAGCSPLAQPAQVWIPPHQQKSPLTSSNMVRGRSRYVRPLTALSGLLRPSMPNTCRSSKAPLAWSRHQFGASRPFAVLVDRGAGRWRPLQSLWLNPGSAMRWVGAVFGDTRGEIAAAAAAVLPWAGTGVRGAHTVTVPTIRCTAAFRSLTATGTLCMRAVSTANAGDTTARQCMEPGVAG